MTHICVSILTIIGSDNGLSPGRRQWWNIVNWTPRNKLQWYINRSSYIFIQENALESVVCEMSVILSWPQCVKGGRCPTNRFYQSPFRINSLRPRQEGRHFPDDIFMCIFLNENVWIPIKISLKFVPKGPIDNIPALVQIMAWRRPGDKPLSEPMMVSLLTHICVTRPQWVNMITTVCSSNPSISFFHKRQNCMIDGISINPFQNCGKVSNTEF